MNKENMKELLNQAKEAAITEESKSLVLDLEALIDLYNQKDEVVNPEEFAKNVQEAREKFLISLGKAAGSVGGAIFPKLEEYTPEQLEKIHGMQQELEGAISSISSLQKLKNHVKARS